LCSGNLHAVAARVNAGDCVSIVAGNTRITPSMMLITPPPAGKGGTVVLGSGNAEMPCRRMHCATFTICASACAEGWVVEPGPGGPPPGRSFRHFACAVLNGGDEGSIPVPTWKRKPPPAFGSGKLGTPLARMHSAYFSESCCNCVWLGAEPELAAPLVVFVLPAAPVDVVVPMLAIDGDFEPPHPAASNEKHARAPSNNEQRTLEPNIGSNGSTPL